MTARPIEGTPDLGDRLRRIGIVDRDADELRARLREGADLGDGRRHVGGVGIRHGLHDDGGSAADDDLFYPDADRPSAGLAGRLHGASSVRPAKCYPRTRTQATKKPCPLGG